MADPEAQPGRGSAYPPAANAETDPLKLSAATARTERRRGPSGSVWGLFGSAMFAQALSLLVSPFLAKALGPAGRGRAALVTVYDDASTSVFNLGMPQAVGFFAKDAVYGEAQLLGACVKFGAAMLVVSVPAAAASITWPLGGVDAVTKALSFVLIGLSPLFALLGVTGRQLLITRGDLRGLRNTNLLGTFLRVTVIAVTYPTHALTLPVAVVGLSYSTYAGTLYCWGRCRVWPAFPSAPLRPLVSYGIRAMPLTLSNLANGRLDQIVIAPLLGAHALGLYAIGVTINTPIIQFGTAFSYGSYRHVPTTEDETRPIAARIVRRAWISVVVAVIPVAGFVMLGGIGIIYGSAYAQGWVPALALIPGSVASAVSGVMQQIALSAGRPSSGSAGVLATIIALAALIPVGITLWRLPGAAIAASTAYGVGLLVNAYLLRRMGLRKMIPTVRQVLTELGGYVRQVRRR